MRTDALQRRDYVAVAARILLAVFGGYAFCWG